MHHNGTLDLMIQNVLWISMHFKITLTKAELQVTMNIITKYHLHQAHKAFRSCTKPFLNDMVCQRLSNLKLRLFAFT